MPASFQKQPRGRTVKFQVKSNLAPSELWGGPLNCGGGPLNCGGFSSNPSSPKDSKALGGHWRKAPTATPASSTCGKQIAISYSHALPYHTTPHCFSPSFVQTKRQNTDLPLRQRRCDVYPPNTVLRTPSYLCSFLCLPPKISIPSSKIKRRPTATGPE